MPRARATKWKALTLVALAAALGGCAKTPRTLVVTVGGAGFSQMHDLRMAIKDQCPEAEVVSAGMWDAYKADIGKIVAAKPRDHVILIGHSFGCGAIDDAADALPRVDLAVFIDPAWNDFSLSRTIARHLWFQRSTFGIEREAKILGASGAKKIEGGHNDIPHSPELIAQVVAEVNRIARQKPVARAAGPGEILTAGAQRPATR
jgi:hypothetical protein